MATTDDFERGWNAAITAARKVCMKKADDFMAHAKLQGHSQAFIVLGENIDELPDVVVEVETGNLSAAEVASLIAFACDEAIGEIMPPEPKP